MFPLLLEGSYRPPITITVTVIRRVVITFTQQEQPHRLRIAIIASTIPMLISITRIAAAGGGEGGEEEE